MPLFHHVPLRVLWADTDPAGIVWFGVFFRYFEQAEEELFRRLGQDRTRLLHQLGIFMPRTSLQSRFRSPARLGDEIAVGVG
ncbi:MAG TPA: acyl-CoA thioesterase, partial [Vicinamibacterales bacterium]|nr:acyl-CoA thioesterase [Vicinamibacterales bacterium]